MKGWLTGPTYQAYSRAASAERVINWFPQTIERPNAKASLVLMPTPGLITRATLTDRPLRSMLFQNGRLFAVAGRTLFEVFADWTSSALGTVALSGDPAGLASNGSRGNQLIISSNGLAYIYNTSTGTFSQITDAQLPSNIITVGYGDGYFLAITTDRFAISALLDGTSWAGDEGQRLGASEAIRGGIVDHEILWLFGHLRTETWFNSGAAAFPWEPLPGTFIESGLGAAHAITRLGDSIAWLLEDERGARQVVRNQGYNAVPISTAGIDAMLTALPSVVDFRAWSYQILGHTFAVFSSVANRLTLQYDTKEQAWSELSYFNPATGLQEAHRASCHCYAFGKHLVGDRETGQIHELTMDAYDDAGAAIRRVRRSPTLSAENRMLFHHELEIEAEMGVGLSSGQGSTPTIMLSWSDDDGATWATPQTATLGALGTYGNRARFFLLGSSRKRIYEVAITDPVKAVLVDGYLRVSEGVH